MQQWCPLYRDSTVASYKKRWVQPKILVLIINFFSLNFTSTEIEGERLSSSQNEGTLGRGGVFENEQARTRGRGRVKTRESWVNVLLNAQGRGDKKIDVEVKKEILLFFKYDNRVSQKLIDNTFFPNWIVQQCEFHHWNFKQFAFIIFRHISPSIWMISSSIHAKALNLIKNFVKKPKKKVWSQKRSVLWLFYLEFLNICISIIWICFARSRNMITTTCTVFALISFPGAY